MVRRIIFQLAARLREEMHTDGVQPAGDDQRIDSDLRLPEPPLWPTVMEVTRRRPAVSKTLWPARTSMPSARASSRSFALGWDGNRRSPRSSHRRFRSKAAS